jgi:putative ABC transport system ATP-binding protein
MSIHASLPSRSAAGAPPVVGDWQPSEDHTGSNDRSAAVLELQGVIKSYPEPAGGELTVLKSVSLRVMTGETVAIVGPSGSGKTTLLGLCAGLDRPTRGRVILAGMDLASLDEDARARLRAERIGFVFQNFQLVPTLTALENVMVPAELMGRGGSKIRAQAMEWLGRVGLAGRTEHYPVQLSGGEQQRVALARAFMNRPQILFADEPTGNLDGETSAKIEELLFSLNAGAGTTLVIVTHNPELARRCQRVIRMRDGEAYAEAA